MPTIFNETFLSHLAQKGYSTAQMGAHFDRNNLLHRFTCIWLPRVLKAVGHPLSDTRVASLWQKPMRLDELAAQLISASNQAAESAITTKVKFGFEQALSFRGDTPAIRKAAHHRCAFAFYSAHLATENAAALRMVSDAIRSIRTGTQQYDPALAADYFAWAFILLEQAAARLPQLDSSDSLAMFYQLDLPAPDFLS